MQCKDFTARVIEYIREKYGAEPEFLWENDFDNAAFRHAVSKKWFAALLMNTKRSVLGLPGEGRVDIIDVKCDPLVISQVVDGKGILPGYHMNKRHWLTLVLDGSAAESDVFALIDMSYNLIDRKSKRRTPPKT